MNSPSDTAEAKRWAVSGTFLATDQIEPEKIGEIAKCTSKDMNFNLE